MRTTVSLRTILGTALPLAFVPFVIAQAIWSDPATGPPGAAMVTVDNNGNVGIATGGASANKLAVGGNLSLDPIGSVAAPQNGLYVSGKFGARTASPKAELSVAGPLVIGRDTVASDAFVTVAAPLNSLVVKGRVGIGASNPFSLLSLAGGGMQVGRTPQAGRAAPVARAETDVSIATGAKAETVGLTIDKSGLPTVAYVTTLGELKLVRCKAFDCSDTFAPVALDGSGVSGSISLALGSNGYPMVSYVKAGQLYLAACTDVGCSQSSTFKILSVSTGATVANSGTSLFVSHDGLPAISYQVFDGEYKLAFVKCNDTACSPDTPYDSRIIGDATDMGLHNSMALGVDGMPILSAYHAGMFENLRMVKCVKSDCSGSNNKFNTLDQDGDVGSFSSLTIGMDGLPVISYYDATNGNLKFVRCATIACDTAKVKVVVVDDAFPADVGRATSVTINRTGLPLMVYYDATSGDLKIAACADERCSLVAVRTIVSGGDSGMFSSLAVGADGLPVIAYYRGDGTVRVFRCASERCMP